MRDVGFWLKQSVFREQPLVQYKKDLIVNLYGDDTVITWSSNPVYNKFRIATLAQPSVLVLLIPLPDLTPVSSLLFLCRQAMSM
jgi:hypothetical protein